MYEAWLYIRAWFQHEDRLGYNEKDISAIIESKGRTGMEVVMKEQDKRAVESMCRCGLDIEGVIGVFPAFPKEDVMAIYKSVKGLDTGTDGETDIRINCS